MMRSALFLLSLFCSMLYSQQFTKVTAGNVVSDGGDSRGVNWIDTDNDGDLDLFITNGPKEKANNFFYRNDGNGTFTSIKDISIVNDPGSFDGSTWADYDNDGYVDVFAATWWGEQNSLHRNYLGIFEKVTRGDIAGDITYSETGSWGDYDNDGYVDLYLANSADNKANSLYRNNGNGTFTKVTTGPQVMEKNTSRSADWFDADNDGDLDLFSANEGGENNSLYRNLGNGQFETVTSGAIVTDGGDSFGSSIGDIDNDGYFDVLVTNHDNTGNFLYKNNGDGTFQKVTSGIVVTDGGYSVGSAFGDIDNDGDLDLVVANAFAPANGYLRNFVYTNNGDGTFNKVTTGGIPADSGWSYGVAMGDYDRDGDLDVAFANCFGTGQNNALYRNDGNANHWLTVNLRGSVSNRSGIGTKVNVKAMINGSPVWQYRQVAGQSGYCGQNLESHFGVGNAMLIDSLVVLFPSGQTVIHTNVSPGQVLTIDEPVPGSFLRAAFIADSLGGRIPFTVHFNDISVAPQSDPVMSWEWDFNGDGTIDATTKNAQFTYTQRDTYSVSLRVVNGAAADTLVAHRLIYVVRPPSLPVLTAYSPSADTTVPKNGKVQFSVSIVDTSDSPVTFVWRRNSVIQAGSSASYAYSSNFLAPAPRTDTVTVTVANGFSSFQKKWLVTVKNVVNSIDGDERLLLRNNLLQNFPNPFNPSTRITFELGNDAGVMLKLYDSVGREIRTLVNGHFSRGTHTVELDGQSLSSGTYFYTITAGSYASTKKFILTK